MITIKDKNYYNAKEIAKMFGMDYTNLSKWRKRGLRHLKLSQKKHLYLKEDVDNFLMGVKT